MKLLEVCQLAGKYALSLQKQGAAATYVGVPGMLALMQENIKRYFTDGGETDEIIRLAANGLLCLQVALENAESMEDLAEEEYEEDDDLDLGGEDEEEDLPATATAPRLPPIPPEFRNWNYDSGIAAQFEGWLHENGHWDKLPTITQNGITDAVAGDVDQVPEGIAGREGAFEGAEEDE